MLFDPPDNTSFLLGTRPAQWDGGFFLHASLPLLVALSSVGMLVLKSGERRASAPIIVCGLVMEASAFLLYPYSMRKYQLRTITTCWSGGSIVAAVVGGRLLFDEVPTYGSLAGCALVVAGILVGVFA